jgi:hypothetical protein
MDTDLHDDNQRAACGAMFAARIGSLRGEMLRVDAKTNTLLGMAGVLLAGAITIMGGGKIHGLAEIVGWAAVLCVGAAVVLLANAARPKLDGDFGFVAWSRHTTPAGLLADVLGDVPDGNTLLAPAEELLWLSKALMGKYRCIRSAVHLILAGLGVAAIAALLAAA